MSIRWRLNLSILALIAVFLIAAAFSMHAVRRNAEQSLLYARTRELSQFTADVRTHLYQHLSPIGRRIEDSVAVEPASAWPRFLLDDIDVQIRLAEAPREQALWTAVRAGVERIDDFVPDDPALFEAVRAIERDLRELRSYYDLAQTGAIAANARTSLLAQAAIAAACLLTVLLFLINLAIIRKWLIRPIEVLRESAETMGEGRLEHRVPLSGQDELARLARGLEDMARNLARFQSDLVRSRELSTLGELCANVAHGLRNPLAAIRSTAQLAEARAESPELATRFRELADQADRMDRRITTLFQFSRPLELQRRAVRFEELARAAQAQAFPLLQARGIRLEIDDRTDTHQWEVDCDQLAQGLAELITNAAHHSPEGARIVLSARAATNGTPGRAVEITVRDTGRGMAPATLEKAFDLFFTSRPDGTGMGLALVRRIVEKHGGQIQLTSEPGAGTTVHIVIPETAPQRTANRRRRIRSWLRGE